jgi:uncharacterized membrane protein YphA (DoxX/SURF4 family)
MSLDPLLLFTTQLFLGLLLLAAGLHKAADLRRVTAVIAAYRVLPAALRRPMASLVMGVEIAIGLALLIPFTRRPAALMAAALLALYMTLMAVSLLPGHRDVDCGCSFRDSTTQPSAYHIIRNGTLVIFALCAVMPDSGRAIGWLEKSQIAAAVVSLALIYLSVDALLAFKSGPVLPKEV